jgi:hypothetical protein
MRSHGVPDFGDPNETTPADRVNKHAPAFVHAAQACRPEAVAMAAAKPRHKSAAEQLRYARCMRDHGVRDFPDPLPNGGFRIPNAVNTQSSAFNAASRACGSGQPPAGAHG